MKAASFVASFFFAFFILNPAVIGQAKDSAAEAKHQNKEFCSNNHRNGDKVSFSETREFTVPSTGSLNVDGNRNGGISVVGENRSDILIKACVQAWGSSDDAAKTAASSVKIQAGTSVSADGPDSNWSVSYRIAVPRNTALDLTAVNGGISIKSVDGIISFETVNGGVSLSDLSGLVRGRTTNGGVKVSLTGPTWRGSGLDVTTSNGGVKLSVPAGYAATFETGTTNGGLKSEIAELAVQTENRDGETRGKRIVASMNGGGPTIRVVTTNGGVNIGSDSN